MIDAPGSDRVFTIPNLISFIRLLGVGVFWWVLLGLDNVALAAVFIFMIGWTDWIDGYLARKLDQVSKLGEALDPVADRLMIFSAVVGGLIAGVVPIAVGAPLLARELVMGTIALYLYARGAGTLEVRYLGKLATFLLYGAIPSFYLAAVGIVPWLFETAAWISAVIGLALYWYVALLYMADARRAMSGLESSDPPEET